MFGNPSIIKFFRYAKLGENAGYGIHKMVGWEQLTGEKVTFDSDIDSSTVTYYRPKIGAKNGGSTAPKTAPKTEPKTAPKRMDDIIISIIRSTPNITKAEIAKICGLSESGVRYYIDKLRKEERLEWEGHSRTGRWVIKK